jgi:hypothetical protein
MAKTQIKLAHAIVAVMVLAGPASFAGTIITTNLPPEIPS